MCAYWVVPLVLQVIRGWGCQISSTGGTWAQSSSGIKAAASQLGRLLSWAVLDICVSSPRAKHKTRHIMIALETLALFICFFLWPSLPVSQMSTCSSTSTKANGLCVVLFVFPQNISLPLFNALTLFHSDSSDIYTPHCTRYPCCLHLFGHICMSLSPLLWTRNQQ